MAGDALALACAPGSRDDDLARAAAALDALADARPRLDRVFAAAADAESAARLVAAADSRRIGLGKTVAEAFVRNASSGTDLAAFVAAYDRATRGSFRLNRDWLARAVAARAAATGRLDELLDAGGTTTEDAVRAALGSSFRWSEAAADPAKRSLIRAAFADARVSPGGGGVPELMDWGAMARDSGAVDDAELWAFYCRLDAADGAARDRRLRAWLVEVGGSRLTNALRDAVVDAVVVASSRKK